VTKLKPHWVFRVHANPEARSYCFFLRGHVIRQTISQSDRMWVVIISCGTTKWKTWRKSSNYLLPGDDRQRWKHMVQKVWKGARIMFDGAMYGIRAEKDRRLLTLEASVILSRLMRCRGSHMDVTPESESLGFSDSDDSRVEKMPASLRMRPGSSLKLQCFMHIRHDFLGLITCKPYHVFSKIRGFHLQNNGKWILRVECRTFRSNKT